MPNAFTVVSGLSIALALLTAVLAGLLWRNRQQQRAQAAELARLRQQQTWEQDHRRQLQTRLTQSQPLEAIGQLAAGIAHEINTPIQYIGDNLRFLQEGFDSLERLLTAYQARARHEEILRLWEEVDMDYLGQEIPNALAQSLEGVERVAEIVRAIKQIVHPGSAGKVPLDINAALLGALNISRHEWKYVAETVTDLDPQLPRVPALAGELSQALLNIILNAVHAMEEVRRRGGSGRGTLTVTTRRDADWAEIAIKDTGTGIPAAIRERIFEPFFTTKEPGRGTGQGLAIAKGVMDRHGGTLTVDSQEGTGSTFTLRLPLTARE